VPETPPQPVAPIVRALVVDDDASLSTPVHGVLSGIGCDEVRFATLGEDALRIASDFAPDLVLLDVGLPDMDGIEVCRQLVVLLPDVPIIVVTARNDESVVQVVFDAGAVDYVAKPFRLGELGARARAALRLRFERLIRGQREDQLVAQALQLRASKNQLERFVCIDALTGIANRGHFDELLATEWSRATRQCTPLSLVLVDVDDFHTYNEAYSHVGGDVCLKAVSRALAHCLHRPSDVLARYGGEELVALLPDTDAAGAGIIAERLRACVEDLQIPHARSRCAKVVTISVGVATIAPSADLARTSLVSAADAALFRAKGLGRNLCCAGEDVMPTGEAARPPRPIGPVVSADPYMAQHIPRFLENRRSEIARLRDGVRNGQLESVRAFGSTLKGSGVTFGFETLTLLGARLEHAASRGDRAGLLLIFDELAWYLEHVQVVYRRRTIAMAALPKT
jgi:diguanylate cyclase (GGDEF)-like protein